jgi:hypothetical protein
VAKEISGHTSTAMNDHYTTRSMSSGTGRAALSLEALLADG